MPGELGDEQESQNVGYYERRYTPYGEWMKSKPDSVPSEEEEKKSEQQVKRVLKNLRKNLFKG